MNLAWLLKWLPSSPKYYSLSLILHNVLSLKEGGFPAQLQSGFYTLHPLMIVFEITLVHLKSFSPRNSSPELLKIETFMSCVGI